MKTRRYILMRLTDEFHEFEIAIKDDGKLDIYDIMKRLQKMVRDKLVWYVGYIGNEDLKRKIIINFNN